MTDLQNLDNITESWESAGFDYSEDTLRKIFTKLRLNEELTEKAIEDYHSYREAELSTVFGLLSADDLRDFKGEPLIKLHRAMELASGVDIIESIFREYLYYVDAKQEIAKTYQETGSWKETYYNSYDEDSEAFIDLIEAEYKTTIKDVKHLQKLTGITTLRYWDEDKEEYREAETEKEAKEIAKKELERTLLSAREQKYKRALRGALRQGAKYKELLEMDPKKYNLPDSWIKREQYNSIIETISIELSLDSSSLILVIRPGLRAIAEELEAPYSVILDSYYYYKNKYEKE